MPLEPYLQVIRDPLAQTFIVGVLLLIVLDFVVGFTGAAITNNLRSEKMREGLLHKFMELSAVMLAAILDGFLLAGLNLAVEPILLGCCGYIAFMEVTSVLELIKTYNPEASGLVGWLTSVVKAKEETHG